MSKELFIDNPTKIAELLNNTRLGLIGLPDLQRPFVWPDVKVRNLFDSMMRGYPIGYIMLWYFPTNYTDGKSSIGLNSKTHSEPKILVIDGQQRLTALMSAMYGVKIKDKKYREREIKISYCPLTKEFAVWSQAYAKNPEWISKISDVFKAKEKNAINSLEDFIKEFVKGINEGRIKKGITQLTESDIVNIRNNIEELLSLTDFLLPTLEISHEVDEEAVAEIFVRVNSGGKSLNESDFIQTLISVYDNETRNKIDKFAAESGSPIPKSSYNTIIELTPAHIIRMTVGLGFKRARLKYAYMLLRGKNLETGDFSFEEQNKNLAFFKESLEKVMNVNTWHAFINAIGNAGYHDKRQIASNNAVVFCYIFYLIGKHDYHLTELQLNQYIAKWFFVSSLTSYYTSSVETTLENQFNDLKSINSGNEFIAYFDKTISTIFTDDYFKISLPNDLNKSATTSPIWNGFVASQIILGTNLLFSNTPIAKFFMPGTVGTKNAIDRHHIFPKNYLDHIGVTSDREKNQLANFIYIDYPNNIDISDNPPSDYVPKYREKMGEKDFAEACEEHALPVGFENMDYQVFQEKRRVLMAMIIKKAYDKLCQ